MYKYEPNSHKIIYLSESTLERIRGHRRTNLKIELAKILGLSINSIYRLLRDNSPNSPLTTLAAIGLIGSTLNLSTDQIIEVKTLCP